MKSIRISNIECRRYLGKDFYEIIHWHPNQYFGKLDEYIEKGWIMSPLGEFLRKDNSSIDINFFKKNPETCYVVAWLNRDSESWYLQAVGSRPVELDKEDFRDFIEIWKYADKKLNKRK